MDENQIIVPQSFVALFVPPGRIKPTQPREVIAARYELCEDLAQALIERAQAVHFDTGADEAEVLRRVELGLGPVTPDSEFGEAEARWVVRRLAELLGWPDPGAAAAAVDSGET
ncbi:MAG: ATPase with chaperone activity [Burkholderiales bacterium]|nr:ATPase with chaperone activity [Burkholderiales bacterium]